MVEEPVRAPYRPPEGPVRTAREPVGPAPEPARPAVEPVFPRREYPVKLIVNDERAESRFWGHPVIGVAVRLVALLPHLLWITVIAALGLVWMALIGWIPILLLGRVPGLQAEISEELVHRSSRIAAYAMMLPGYPKFGVGEPGPVDVWFDLEGRRISRLWGIPLIGPIVRLLVLIPHVIVLLLLGLVAVVVWLFAWIPIFILARIPNWMVRYFGTFLRYRARVAAYAFMLPVPYPPFSLR